MAELVVDGTQLTERLVISLRMPAAFGLRMWLTAKVICLAGWISPVSIEASIEEADGKA